MKLTFGFFLCVVSLFSQTQTKVTPDCTLGTIVLTSGQSSANYDNRTTSANNGVPCTQWTLEYFTTNGGTITGSGIQIQVSGDTAGTPTSFALAVAATTTPSGRVQFDGSAGSATNGYYPWLRVTMATGTGSVRATLNGWRENADTINSGGGSSSGCVGTSATPCIVAGPDAVGAASTQPPVQIAGNDGTNVRAVKTDTGGRTQVVGPDNPGAVPTGNPVLAGAFDGTNAERIRSFTDGRLEPALATSALADGATNTAPQPAANNAPLIQNVYPSLFNSSTWDRQFVATLNNAVTITAATDVIVVPLASSITSRMTKLFITWDNMADVTIRQGTGSTCGTNTVALTGAFKSMTGLFLDYNTDSALRTTVAARDICLHFSTSVTGGGQAIYAQF